MASLLLVFLFGGCERCWVKTDKHGKSTTVYCALSFHVGGFSNLRPPAAATATFQRKKLAPKLCMNVGWHPEKNIVYFLELTRIYWYNIYLQLVLSFSFDSQGSLENKRVTTEPLQRLHNDFFLAIDRAVGHVWPSYGHGEAEAVASKHTRLLVG